MDFNIIVKGVRYQLKAYKEYLSEWDLLVDGKMVCDSRPYSLCLNKFLNMISD